jgi:hypothetical protein
MKSGNGDDNKNNKELYDALIKEIREKGLLNVKSAGTLEKKDVILMKAAQLLKVEGYPEDKKELEAVLNTNTVQQNFKGVLESLDFISLLQSDYPNLSEDVKTKFGYFDPSTKSLALDFQRVKNEMEKADEKGQQEGQRSYDSDDDDDLYGDKKRIIPPDGFPVLELQPLSEIHKSKEAAAAARKIQEVYKNYKLKSEGKETTKRDSEKTRLAKLVEGLLKTDQSYIDELKKKEEELEETLYEKAEEIVKSILDKKEGLKTLGEQLDKVKSIETTKKTTVEDIKIPQPQSEAVKQTKLGRSLFAKKTTSSENFAEIEKKKKEDQRGPSKGAGPKR